MAKQLLKKGITSKSVAIFIVDTTSSSGSGLTGLTSGSSGLTAWYWREGAATPIQIPLTTGVVGTWTNSGSNYGFIEVDAVNLPGVYQLDLPNAAVASGANWVVAQIKGATNMAPAQLELQLSDVDVNNGTSFGLTDLDAPISSRLAASAIALSSGEVTVGTNLDKTGYNLANNAVDAAQFTQAAADRVWTSAARTLTAFAQSFSDQVWSTVARTLTAFGFNVTVASNLDKTGYELDSTGLTAIDTQLSSIHGAGQWGIGTGIGVNTVTIMLQTTGAAPIANQQITIKNSAQTAVVAVGFSDANGRVIVNLNNGTYEVLVGSSMFYNALPAQSLTVNGTTSVTYTLTATFTPTATPPSLCNVYGFLMNLDGSPLVGATVTFTLNEQAASDAGALQSLGTGVNAAPLVLTTDSLGHFATNLIQSATLASLFGNSSTHYRITIQIGTTTFIDGWCLIPSQSSVNFTSLTIAPAIPQVIYGPPGPTFNRP